MDFIIFSMSAWNGQVIILCAGWLRCKLIERYKVYYHERRLSTWMHLHNILVLLFLYVFSISFRTHDSVIFFLFFCFCIDLLSNDGFPTHTQNVHKGKKIIIRTKQFKYRLQRKKKQIFTFRKSNISVFCFENLLRWLVCWVMCCCTAVWVRC